MASAWSIQQFAKVHSSIRDTKQFASNVTAVIETQPEKQDRPIDRTEAGIQIALRAVHDLKTTVSITASFEGTSNVTRSSRLHEFGFCDSSEKAYSDRTSTLPGMQIDRSKGQPASADVAIRVICAGSSKMISSSCSECEKQDVQIDVKFRGKVTSRSRPK
jgi:hypothetical protein